MHEEETECRGQPGVAPVRVTAVFAAFALLPAVEPAHPVPGLALLGGTPALAQTVNSPTPIDTPYRWRERGTRLGYTAGFHSADRGALNFAQGSALTGGFKARFRVSNPLSLELGAAFSPANRYVLDFVSDSAPAWSDTVAAGWLRTDVGVQFSLPGARTWHSIQPSLVFGGGFLFGVDEGAAQFLADPVHEPYRYNIATAPHLYAGAAVEFYLSESLSIGLEARDYLTRVTAPDGFLVSTTLNLLEETGLPAVRRRNWHHNLDFGIVVWLHY